MLNDISIRLFIYGFVCLLDMEARKELIIEVKIERNFVKMDSKLELCGMVLG